MRVSTPPPQLFLRIFRWFCHPRLKDHIEGDLLELYYERLKRSGKKEADIRFIVDVILLFRPGIIRPFKFSLPVNQHDMLGNYLKVGIRNLLRYKTFSLINVFGLSIAMSVCMLVILMLSDQHMYDRFHPEKERIFRVLSGQPNSSAPFASTPPALAEALREEYSVAEAVTQVIIGVGGEAASENAAVEMRGFFADEHFLNVFDFNMTSGNRSNALLHPHSLVISASVAEKLFGSENALGKVITFTDRGLHYLKRGKDTPPVNWGEFTITGVVQTANVKSHLRFDVLMSVSTQTILAADNKYPANPDAWDKAFTYVLVRSGKNQQDLDAALADLFQRRFSHHESLKGFSLFAQPLTAITPGILVNQPPSLQLPVEAYYLLGAIALAIMFSACLNYINLSTARAITRAKEIGIRKVAGANRLHLVFQFLSESIITSCLALMLAMGLLTVIKPAFTGLWLNQYLNFDLRGHPAVYGIFVCLAVGLGIAGGIYPALHLSSFQPVKAIKNPDRISSQKLGLRKVLCAGQFVISLFFIITSILFYTQFIYFMKFDYGFDARNIINIELQGNNYERIASAFSGLKGVTAISASEYIPATGRTSGMSIYKPQTEEEVNFRLLAANETFLGNMRLALVAGVNLPETTDSASRQIIVNESAVKALGFHDSRDIVGTVLIQSWNKEPLEVVGVVRDFWLRPPVGGDRHDPAMLRNVPQRFSFANVKIAGDDVSSTVKELENKWKSLDAAHPFKYSFYDEELSSTHAGIFDLVSIAGFLAFVAITIASLGMLGMAAYTAERKKKEVGIRKVFGARTYLLAWALSKEFVKILLAAVCIGAPFTWFVNNLWLQIFETRAEFGLSTVMQGTSILIALALLTIGSQTVRASRSNPADTLRAD